ncbi:MAG TPA: iron-containing redox enzyme family protein [Gaiellaceae bacterium]|jgi:pyrroloquinoline-quinone synthase|nr:iron-containing redox enzyme family protein [Gaiellaceae bacterium]
MNVIAGIDAARERWDVLAHPFYVRWERGDLTREELARYAGEYRHAVVALARAARTAGLHAEEEAEHIGLWDEFASALGAEPREPLPETRGCASAWAAADDELGAAAILYAIESGQPAISTTKLRGLVEHYGFADESPEVEYFRLHAERDLEHAAEARAALDGAEDGRLVGLAEAALAANWTLLDGVSS